METNTEVKITSKDPTLKYVENPKFNCKTLLENQRKEDMLNDLKKLEGKVGQLKDGKARLEEREACALRLGYKEVPGRTKTEVAEERKHDAIDSLVKKYGHVTVGIHG